MSRMGERVVGTWGVETEEEELILVDQNNLPYDHYRHDDWN
jgi:hypothetical protein